MAIDNITVTPEILIKTASELEDISNQLKNCFDNITSSIEVIRGKWVDENGATFSERYENEVKPKLSAYYDAIMEHSNYVGEAAKIYQETIGTIHSSVHSSATVA